MTAVVDWLGTRFRLGRKVAFALILSLAVCFLSLIVWLSGPRIIDQFADLQADLPKAAHQLVARIQLYGWGRWLLTQWFGYSQLSSSVNSALTRIGGIVLSTATVLSGLVLVGFLGLYLGAEPEVYFSYVQRATPSALRAKLNVCAAATIRNLRWWVFSQMLSVVHDRRWHHRSVWSMDGRSAYHLPVRSVLLRLCSRSFRTLARFYRSSPLCCWLLPLVL